MSLSADRIEPSGGLPSTNRTHHQERRGPVVLAEGEAADWRRQAVPMLARGVVVGRTRIARRQVVRTLLVVVKAWWNWTVADAGAVFIDLQRDLLVQVHSGVGGGGRMVRVLPAEATQYPVVQRVGLDAVFALTPVERSPYTWRNVAPAGFIDSPKGRL